MASAESGWLEPENGVFAEGFRQDDLLLRAALLGDDHYRQCQLVAMPSFDPRTLCSFAMKTPSPPSFIGLYDQSFGRN